MKIRFLLMLVVAFTFAGAQSPQELTAAFDRAAAEFGVPADILKAISFSETRWTHLQWSDGDTMSACNGMPRLYGVMGLWNNEHFGRSLVEGAHLIGQSVEAVKRDFVQNIRAGAALLRKYRDEGKTPAEYAVSDLESWYPVVARHSGIPQTDLALSHAHQVLSVVAAGYHDHGIEINALPLRLEAIEQKIESHHSDQPATQSITSQPDYPLAKWAPAADGHWYTTGNPYKGIVIHYMEGYYLGTISYFQMSTTQASSHYCVKGAQISPATSRPAGEVTQMVEEKYWAWHAVCLNRYTLGIENEGFTGTDIWWTPEFYQSLANLVKYMCVKYSIPMDRNHIIGHNEWQNSAWVAWAVNNGFPSNVGTCNNHTDPGPLWDWTFFMQLVTDDPTPPKVTSTPQSGKWNVSNKITLTFSQRMEPTSTAAGFGIVPAVAGSLAWSNNNKTMTFTPSTRFEYNTTYTVTLNISAHNYLNRLIDGNGDGVEGDDYGFSFTTIERDSIPPTIIQLAPGDNQVLPSASGPLTVTFSEFLDPTSAILANFLVRDNGGNEIGRSIQHWKVGTRSGVNVWFYAPLSPGIQYELVLKNIRDLGGNALATVDPIRFTIDSGIFQSTVVEPFDATLNNWMAPGSSGSTVGIVPESTSFAYSASRLVPIVAGNTGSGLLTYTWNTGASSWLIREYLSTGTPRSVLWTRKGTSLQAYLFGDGSGTEFRFALDDSVDVYPAGQLANHEVNGWIPITWVGWKLVEWNLESDPIGSWVGNGVLEGQLRFDSFQFRPATPMTTSGTVYIDQLHIVSRQTTDVLGRPHGIQPTTTALLQNFPNPFNPTTVVSYQLSVASEVRLRVHDVLGREVAVLVDEEKTAGLHTATWEANNFPSGVYFYTLQAGPYRETKRMVLTK